MCAYYVMPKYDLNLSKFLENFSGLPTEKYRQIIRVAIELVDILKIIHASHRTYNDLRPENIMIDTQENGSTKVTLVDFG